MERYWNLSPRTWWPGPRLLGDKVRVTSPDWPLRLGELKTDDEGHLEGKSISCGAETSCISEGLSHPSNLRKKSSPQSWKNSCLNTCGKVSWMAYRVDYGGYRSAPARSLSKERFASQVWGTGVGHKYGGAMGNVSGWQLSALLSPSGSAPAMQDMRVQSLGWEDLLEKEMATDSCILAWEIPWTEESGGLLSLEFQRVRHNWAQMHPPLQIFPF